MFKSTSVSIGLRNRSVEEFSDLEKQNTTPYEQYLEILFEVYMLTAEYVEHSVQKCSKLETNMVT